MNNFKLLSEGINVDACLAELEAMPEVWDEFTLRQDIGGSPHKDTKCIPLRVPKELSHAAIFDDVEAHNSFFCRDMPMAVSLMHRAASIGPKITIGRVMLVELEPQGHVTAHVDEGIYAASYDRLHLVLTSDEGNRFRCGEEEVWMKPGELWAFNNKVEHEVFNDSASPRIHMIIDVREEY